MIFLFLLIDLFQFFSSFENNMLRERDNDSDPDDPQIVKRLKRESTLVKKLSIRHELPKENRSHHAIQNFRNKWYEKHEYKKWLTSVEDKPLKAKCKVCNTEFLAELTVIKNHGNKAFTLFKNFNKG